MDLLTAKMYFSDLALGDAEEDFHRADEMLDRAVPPNQVCVLESQGRRYLVVAAAMKAFENDWGVSRVLRNSSAKRSTEGR